MAERTIVNRWIRAFLATAAVVIGSLTVTTITGTTGTFDDVTVTDDLIVGDDITMSGASALITGTTTVGVSGGGGAVFTSNSAGGTIAASGAGDDLTLTANDRISLGGDGGSTTIAFGDTSGWSITATGTGDDIAVQCDDLMSLDATTLSLSAASSGGDIAIDASGVTITTPGAGDDITLNTTGGDDVILTIADDLIATITDDISITADQWSMTNASTTITTFNANGVAINASGANDDVQIDAADDFAWTAGDDITITANGGTLYLDAASGVGPTMPLVGGGTGYRLAPSLEFDFVNAAPGSTAQTIMAALDLPALALSATGRGAQFEFHGLAAANANDKTIRILFGADGSGTGGGTEIATVNVGGAAAAAGGHVWCHGYLYRTAVDTQRAALVCVVGLITRTHSSTAAIDDGAATEVNLTVENPTAASDLTIYGVEWTWL